MFGKWKIKYAKIVSSNQSFGTYVTWKVMWESSRCYLEVKLDKRSDFEFLKPSLKMTQFSTIHWHIMKMSDLFHLFLWHIKFYVVPSLFYLHKLQICYKYISHVRNITLQHSEIISYQLVLRIVGLNSIRYKYFISNIFQRHEQKTKWAKW